MSDTPFATTTVRFHANNDTVLEQNIPGQNALNLPAIGDETMVNGNLYEVQDVTRNYAKDGNSVDVLLNPI